MIDSVGNASKQTTNATP